jgi:4-hydroxy-2-oxoheptanedioate aldolase
MITSNIKKRLKNGEVVVGSFYKTNYQNVVEMMAYAGFDFIIVDNEHSNFDHVDIENIIRAADGVNLDTIIRVPAGSEENTLHGLDSGATGIQIPSLRDVDDAKRIAPFTKYYPEGRRGFNGNQRAAKYGFMNIHEYMKASNENTLLVVQVETLEMVAQVEELCTIPEIDVIFIGPGDLSQAVGKPMKVNDPDVVKVIDSIIEKTKKSGKALGIWVGNMKDAQAYIDKGVRFIGFMSDTTIFANALKEAGKQVEELKKYK